MYTTDKTSPSHGPILSPTTAFASSAPAAASSLTSACAFSISAPRRALRRSRVAAGVAESANKWSSLSVCDSDRSECDARICSPAQR